MSFCSLSSWSTSSCAYQPHYSYQSPPSLSPSVTLSTFHSRLKTRSSLSQILSSIVILIPSELHSRICTELSGHCMAFVCLSYFSFSYFSWLTTCARLSWSHSAFESTLNSPFVSYRVVSSSSSFIRQKYNTGTHSRRQSTYRSHT